MATPAAGQVDPTDPRMALIEQHCLDPNATPSESMTGTEGNDIIIGTPGRDIIMGLGGNDVLCGMGGDDLILSGGGSDAAHGGFGNDKIRGGGGQDLLLGGNGRDKLFGMNGVDTLDGGQGKDRVNGGGGNDLLFGGPGTDKLVGDEGSDELIGNDGRDRLLAGPGDDVCIFDVDDALRPCELFLIDGLDAPTGVVNGPTAGTYDGLPGSEVLLFNGTTSQMTATVDGIPFVIAPGDGTCESADVPFVAIELNAGVHTVRLTSASPTIEPATGTWTVLDGYQYFSCYVRE